MEKYIYTIFGYKDDKLIKSDTLETWDDAEASLIAYKTEYSHINTIELCEERSINGLLHKKIVYKWEKGSWKKTVFEPKEDEQNLLLN